MNTKQLVLALAAGFFFVACENDDNTSGSLPLGDYENGILITNEGPFSNGTGTVSFISDDQMITDNEVYNKVNNADLGNVVQSMAFVGDKAYIIANVSNKITVVNRYTFEEIARIDSGLDNPRFFVEANGKGYVTNWGDTGDETDDFIALINLETNSVDGTIPVDLGPEKLVANNSSIYVAHQGAFGQNNKVSVIDIATETVTTTITVGDVPKAILFDATGDLWVLSAGKPSFSGTETAGQIDKVDTNANEVTDTYNFFAVTEHPNHLGIDGDRLYYSLDSSIYSISISNPITPTASDFDRVPSYAMVVEDGKLYTTDAKDFASNGSIAIYDLATKNELNTFDVGIIPGGVYFN